MTKRPVLRALIPVAAALLCAAAGAQQSALWRHDFETPGQEAAWTGWSVDEPVNIERHSPGYDSDTCLRFSITHTSWDTAIIAFDPPLKVTEHSYVRFKIKADRSGGFGLNVRNATEEAEYYTAFNLVHTDWTVVQRRLADATYKRFGKPGGPRDGVAGDELGSIQIAYLGTEMLIDDFEIVQSDVPLPDLPPDDLEAPEGYSLQDYACLREVFPFGVISTVAAGNAANAELFGQTKQERFEDDLCDLKLRGMNAISNFCDDAQVMWRLDLMDRYHLYLVETMLANSTVAGRPADDPLCRTVRRAAEHSRLLCWYGRDEPTDYRAYLENKAAINALDPEHPVASAFNEMWAAKVLGPFMELVMLDHYSVVPGPPEVERLTYHADLIRDGKRLTAGGKVWFIAQSFSGRSRGRYTWRMPTPEEIRFDVYNSLAAGAGGFLFFIYNDTCTYLDGTQRGEEFDDTLVDPWGNPHPVYEELSDIAEKVVPVMPSFLDATEPENGGLAIRADEGLAVGQLKGVNGTLIVVVNASLTEEYNGAVEVEVPEGQRLFGPLNEPNIPDATGRPDRDILLRPGDGCLLLVATDDQFMDVKRGYLNRDYRRRWEQADVRLGLMAQAGLPVEELTRRLADQAPETKVADTIHVNPAFEGLEEDIREAERKNAPYWNARLSLQHVQTTFGEIHRLIRPRVVAVDGTEDPEWQATFSDIKALSVRYFDARRRWRAGQWPSEEELTGLQRRVGELEEKVARKVGG